MGKYVLGILGLIIGTAVWVGAEGTSGAILLKQGMGARAQGMGEAFAGIADDASALFWNVAGLSQNQGIKATASYDSGLADSVYEQLAYVQSLDGLGFKDAGSVGLGVAMLQGGTMTVDLADGTEKNVQSQNDLSINLSYGIKLAGKVGFGISLKGYRSTLAEEASANALGIDLGVLIPATENLNLGLTLQNAGTEVKYVDEGDPLPLTLRLGAGYMINLTGQQILRCGADLVKTNDHDLALHAGGEYWFGRMLALRLGYQAGYDLAGLSAGFGIGFNVLQLDYAFSLIQDFNAAHKISLSLAI